MSSPYDALAAEYGSLWEPVLAPSALSLLDRCDPIVRRALDAHRAAGGSPSPVVVDVGSGAGILAVDAVSRWPGVTVLATDPSSAMLDAARARARRDLPPSLLERLDFRVAPAHELPFDDGSVDLVVSSFVYQLVPDRVAALREAFRVLRPGGWVAFVTWIADDEPFAPADAFDDALDALDISVPERESDPVSGDYASVDAAVGQLRRIGFSRVRAEPGRLEYRWTPETYLATQERLWESELFATLDADVAARLRDDARGRLSRLDGDAFRWRAPIVFAFGTRAPAGRAHRGWRRGR